MSCDFVIQIVDNDAALLDALGLLLATEGQIRHQKPRKLNSLGKKFHVVSASMIVA